MQRQHQHGQQQKSRNGKYGRRTRQQMRRTRQLAEGQAASTAEKRAAAVVKAGKMEL